MALVRSLVEAATHFGVHTGDLLQGAGLDVEVLTDASARIPNRKFDQLLTLALERSGDPAFGLHMGEHISLACFDVVGYLAYHAQTARESLSVFFRYYRVVCDLEPPQLLEDGEQARFVCRFPRTSETCDRARAEFALARLASLARNALGRPASTRIVTFEHQAPEYASEYQRIFGRRVQFGQPLNSIVFDRQLLDNPLLHDNPQLFRVLEEQAEQRLRTLREPDRVSTRIHALVLDQRGEGGFDMESLARQLGMSARTLRRRLAGKV
jgi:hypothetical protein